ncbi:translation initiation factor IF-2 subunit alpha [Candidatus Methanomassiliicoccus intestinalis]|uniref:translation initiation factor IF-2 subunit alpha n=1 Tax=Candidatus Methanomassiliicoccus intestinalis TaxID=1406512 RepID=UPI0037DD3621
MAARTSEFPEESELVVCTVQSVKNFGAFVSLDEYDNKEGFIHIRDVATGWVKYIRDYVREGQKIVCKVLGVDSSKGHIDLSLKSVNEHQKREKIQQWKNENKADKLLEIVAERLGKTKDACYEEFGYDLIEVFGTLYGSFEQIAIHPESLPEEGFEGDWLDVFVEVAKENVTPSLVQISGILEMVCPLPDGVDHIKDALMAGIAASTEQVKIQYIGAPRYRVVVEAVDYKTAEEDMKLVTATAVDALNSSGGKAAFHRDAK